MATVTRDIAGDGLGGGVSFVYDDVSELVTAVVITQSALGKRQLTVNVLAIADGHTVYSATRAFQSGISTIDVTARNEHLVPSVDKNGVATVVAPYNFQCKWGQSQ
jgi:hypothetical protein